MPRRGFVGVAGLSAPLAGLCRARTRGSQAVAENGDPHSECNEPLPPVGSTSTFTAETRGAWSTTTRAGPGNPRRHRSVPRRERCRLDDRSHRPTVIAGGPSLDYAVGQRATGTVPDENPIVLHRYDPMGSTQRGDRGRRLHTRSRIADRCSPTSHSHARSGGIRSPFDSNYRPGDDRGPVHSYREATTVGQTELRSCCPASPRPVCRTRRCSARGGTLRRPPTRCGYARTGSRVRRGVD